MTRASAGAPGDSPVRTGRDALAVAAGAQAELAEGSALLLKLRDSVLVEGGEDRIRPTGELRLVDGNSGVGPEGGAPSEGGRQLDRGDLEEPDEVARGCGEVTGESCGGANRESGGTDLELGRDGVHF